MRRVVASCVSGLVVAAAVPVAPIASAADGVGQGDGIERVVTLGDSYSAGAGIHRDASDYDDQGPPLHSFSPRTRLGASMCLRELETTPGPRLAEALGARSLVTACAGAVIADVERQVVAASILGDGSGTVVAVTVGGNDVRTRDGDDWSEVLLDCVVSIGCHRHDGNELANLVDVGDDLAALYSTMGETYPGLMIRVFGYPRLMQPDRWGCVGVTGVGKKEARWIDEQVDHVNAVISEAVDRARAATGVDVRFVDVTDVFDNHGACRIWQRDRYVNDAIWGETSSRVIDDGRIVERHHDGLLTLSAASFHPSQKGYDAFFDALSASLLPPA
jgi:lysophospholipase L1-like esterase